MPMESALRLGAHSMNSIEAGVYACRRSVSPLAFEGETPKSAGGKPAPLICRRALGILVFGLASLTAGIPAVLAADPVNPYQLIVERNVFRLKAAAAAAVHGRDAADPPPKITVTGLTTILGDKRVLFKARMQAKSSVAPREESYVLAQGMSEAGIEVLAVDQKAGTATFNNHGVIQLLELATAGAETSPVPPNSMGMPPKPWHPHDPGT